MKRKIEVFTANCPVCDPVVNMVKDLACENCEVTTYDLVKLCDDKSCLAKVKQYGINKVPAVVVNGELLECCQSSSVTRENLIDAGIGQA